MSFDGFELSLDMSCRPTKVEQKLANKVHSSEKPYEL